MVTTLLHVLLALGLQGTPDPLGPYTAVLQEVQQQFPDRQIVVTTPARPECFPHCEESNYAQPFPPEVLEMMQEQGLIVGTCTPGPNMIGCPAESEAWRVDRVMVTFGSVEGTGDGEATVNATLIWSEESLGRSRSSVRGYQYKLCQGEDGGWKVVSSTVTWMV